MIPYLFAILSIITLAVCLIRRWNKREWEWVHWSGSRRRSRECAGTTRTSSRAACGTLALPESPHSSLVCCALSNPNNPGLVTVGIGAGEESRVCHGIVSYLSPYARGNCQVVKLTGRAESAGTSDLNPFHAAHAGRAWLDNVVLRELGPSRLGAVVIPEAKKGWKVSLGRWNSGQEAIPFLQVDSSVVSRRLPLQQCWAGGRDRDEERPNGKSHFESCMVDCNCEREEAPSEHRLECVDEMNACHHDLAERRERMDVFICNCSRGWQR